MNTKPFGLGGSPGRASGLCPSVCPLGSVHLSSWLPTPDGFKAPNSVAPVLWPKRIVRTPNPPDVPEPFPGDTAAAPPAPPAPRSAWQTGSGSRGAGLGNAEHVGSRLLSRCRGSFGRTASAAQPQPPRDGAVTVTSSRPQVVACRDTGGDVVTCCRAMRGDIKPLWPDAALGGNCDSAALLPGVPGVLSE